MPENIPALRYSVFLSAGILAASYTPVNKTLLSFALLISIAIVIISLLRIRKASIAVFVVMILTGALKYNIDAFELPNNSVAFFKESSNVRLICTVSDLPDHDSSKIRFTAESKIIIADDPTECSGLLLVSIYLSKRDVIMNEFQPGQTLILLGNLIDPTGARNPGEFDYRKYLFNKGIYKLFRVRGLANAKIIEDSNTYPLMHSIILPAKQYIINCIERSVPGDEGQYLKGLVAGDRSDISDDVKSAFMDAGVTHLIAVSGLNVAYLIIALTVICSIFRLNGLLSLIIIICFLIFYCLLTGSSASIMRASIMGILALTAIRIQRKTQFYNLLGVSAVLILLIDSRMLFDAGYILSFAATFSMVWIFEKIDTSYLSEISFSTSRIGKFLKLTAAAFFTTFAAQVGTLPVTAQLFGKISIVSFIVNMFAVPLANISLATGFFQVALSLLSDNLSVFAAESNYLLLKIQLSMIRISASLPGSYIYVREIRILGIGIAYAVIVFLITAKDLKCTVRRLIACSAVLSVMALTGSGSSKDFYIHVLDVGQGDGIVAISPDEKVIVIDCGNRADGFDQGERTVAPFLRRMGIDRIDLLALTHNHSDHIGGAPYLLKNFRVDKILYTVEGSNDGIAANILELAANAETEVVIAKRGQIIDAGGGFRLYVMHPFENEDSKPRPDKNTNLNNCSIVMLLKYGEFEMLLTGDAETEAEKRLAENFGSILKCDVLKAGHHGSVTSSSPELIVHTRQKAAIISCGKSNKFNHPSAEILKRFEYAGSDVFRTDITGCVTIKTDGSTFTLSESYSF